VASVISDPTSSNPLFYYLDESNRDHVVWYLDSTTVQDEIRILESLGIKNISLWRIGSEDREIWNHIERFAHGTK
jgi:peptidoglycan-N-acetylglucosamine deacetylase